MSQPGPVGPESLAGFLAGIGQAVGMVVEAVAAPSPGEPHQEPAPGHRHSAVPDDVCDHCPICQGAALLERYGPDVVAELSAMARSLVAGLAAAMDAAAANRSGSGSRGGGSPPDS